MNFGSVPHAVHRCPWQLHRCVAGTRVHTTTGQVSTGTCQVSPVSSLVNLLMNQLGTHQQACIDLYALTLRIVHTYDHEMGKQQCIFLPELQRALRGHSPRTSVCRVHLWGSLKLELGLYKHKYPELTEQTEVLGTL